MAWSPAQNGWDWSGVQGKGEDRIGEGVFFISHNKEQVMSAELWPVDFEAIVKGTVFSIQDCEKILGKKVDDKAYSLALLRLRLDIERGMADRGTPVVAKCDGGGIRILLDSEAVAYTAGRFGLHEEGLSRSHLRASIIDAGKLTEEERATHQRNLQTQAWKLMALQGQGRRRIGPSHGPALEDMCDD